MEKMKLNLLGINARQISGILYIETNAWLSNALERKYLLKTLSGMLILESRDMMFTINILAWFTYYLDTVLFSRIFNDKSFTSIITIIT